MLLGNSEENPVTEERFIEVLAKQTDGVIVCGAKSPDQTLARLAETTPLILVNREVGDIASVLMGIADGMTQVLAHLAKLGHRRCVYLAGPPDIWSNKQRRSALLVAAKQHDLQIKELGPDQPRFEAGTIGADAALAADVTAIVAFNDLMALGVLRRLSERGINVPADVSVVGFDDVLYAAMCDPPLTAVAMPTRVACRLAVDLLIADCTISRESTIFPDMNLSTKLIERASTGPCPPRSVRAPTGSDAVPGRTFGPAPKS